MKIALAQLNYHIGNFDSNVEKIITVIHQAQQAKVDIIVFAELSVCGYPPRDFLEFDDFINRCYCAIEKIAKECYGIAAVVGSPSYNTQGKGKHLFNSAFFLENGQIQRIINKSLLPNYDIFDEYRYFEPNHNFEIINYKSKKIAVTLCEDLWNISDVPLYVMNPMDELAKFCPDVVINIAASPFHYYQSETRKDILKKNALHYNVPIIYVNHVGAQTELLFDGGSMVVSNEGTIIEELCYFKEDFKIIDLNNKVANQTVQASAIEKIHDALVMGIKDYFHKLGFKKGILGLSGGIDSAVCLVLAAKALGEKNVKAILMPSRYSSEHSINDSKELVNNINVDCEIISIEETFNSFEKSLKPLFNGLADNIAEENIQARIRAVLLMALSNKFEYILLNTSNKSEVAVGYGTLYGDMCGGISVIGDVYKTQVYELAKYINKNKTIIPLNIINKPPSAELRPNQKDSDSLPPYEIMDKILFHYIEQHKGPTEIIQMGFDKLMVEKILMLINTTEYKRYQTPPILRISFKSFGTGRRMPIVAKYLS